MANLPQLAPKVPELGEITFNYDEIKEALEESLKKYDNMVFTPDTERDARAFLADLRRLDKSIDSERKTVKKVWNLPYDRFEKKMKTLQEMIRERITGIDSQVQVFEDQRKEQKLQEIKELFDSMMADVAELHDYIRFDELFNDRWLNKTYSIDAITEEISKAITDTQDSIETIKSLNSTVEIELLDEFKRCGDLVSTLKSEQRFKAIEAEKEARKNQELEQMALDFSSTEEPVEETEEPVIEESNAVSTEPDAVAEIVEDESTSKKHQVEEIYQFTFRVEANEAQVKALSQCLLENNIKFEILEK